MCHSLKSCAVVSLKCGNGLIQYLSSVLPVILNRSIMSVWFSVRIRPDILLMLNDVKCIYDIQCVQLIYMIGESTEDFLFIGKS